MGSAEPIRAVKDGNCFCHFRIVGRSRRKDRRRGHGRGSNLYLEREQRRFCRLFHWCQEQTPWMQRHGDFREGVKVAKLCDGLNDREWAI